MRNKNNLSTNHFIKLNKVDQIKHVWYLKLCTGAARLTELEWTSGVTLWKLSAEALYHDICVIVFNVYKLSVSVVKGDV